MLLNTPCSFRNSVALCLAPGHQQILMVVTKYITWSPCRTGLLPGFKPAVNRPRRCGSDLQHDLWSAATAPEGQPVQGPAESRWVRGIAAKLLGSLNDGLPNVGHSRLFGWRIVGSAQATRDRMSMTECINTFGCPVRLRSRDEKMIMLLINEAVKQVPHLMQRCTACG